MFRCLRESWHKMANLDPGNKTSGIIPSNFGNCQSWKKKHWIPFLPQSWKWKITTIKETDFRDGTYFSFPWIMGGKSSTTRIYWKLPPCWESFQQFGKFPREKSLALKNSKLPPSWICVTIAGPLMWHKHALAPWETSHVGQKYLPKPQGKNRNPKNKL